MAGLSVDPDTEDRPGVMANRRGDINMRYSLNHNKFTFNPFLRIFLMM
jgi:hypothetical protein